MRPIARCSLLLLLAPYSALAIAAAPAVATGGCTAPAPLPAALAPWSRPAAPATGAALSVGQSRPVALLARPGFATLPGREPKPDSLGAVVPLAVTGAGRYRIMLSTPAWIDMLDDGGTSIASVGHAHGPACSGIAKIVAFDLRPGTYRLQISGAAVSSARLLMLAGGL